MRAGTLDTPGDGADANLLDAITRNGKAEQPFNLHHPTPPVVADRRGQALSFFSANLRDAARIWGCIVLSTVLTAFVLLVAKVYLADFGTFAQSLTNVWIYDVFSVVFYVYAIGILMPFFLFLLWRVGAETRTEIAYCMPPPFVSIVIPAFNEDNNVFRALECALSQDYPAFEVIIVDDGSRDLTKYVANSFQARLISLRQNIGKAAALNIGLKAAKGDIVVFSDSDSSLDRHALRLLVGHFSDPDVGAVAGRVQLRQCSLLVQKLQELEYVFGQDIIKMAQIGSGASVSVCPGPICAFRRAILIEHGGLSDRTLAEDFDLTLSLIGLVWRVKFEPYAVAYTDAPGTWRELFSQRIRWSRGALQVFSQHRQLFFSRRSAALGIFWLPYFLLAGFGGALFEALVVVVIPILVIISGAPLAMIKIGIIFLFLIEAVSMVQYIVAVFLSKSAPNKLALWAVMIKPLNMFLTWVRLIAIWREIRGAKMCW